ncbi:MAG TPA: hypothetical protein VFM77_20530, partial [Terriglobales bacterium]|nr:hypothetical protein [Terriglobales bacterium]
KALAGKDSGAARLVTLMELGIETDMSLTTGKPGRTSTQASNFLTEVGEVLLSKKENLWRPDIAIGSLPGGLPAKPD